MKNELFSILLPFFKRIIVERLPDGGTRPAVQSRRDGRLCALFLSGDIFRDDPKHVAAAGRMRVLELPRRWLVHTFLQFYDQQPRRPQLPAYMNPSPGDDAYQYKKEYQRFLERFLPLLFDELGIDCVIGQHMHHLPDIDWGEVSQKSGRPYLVFHREAIIVSAMVRERVQTRLSKLGTFRGAHVVVQTDGAAQTCIESGFVQREQISALGAVRMDALARDMAALRANVPREGNCVLFAFGGGLLRDSFRNLFEEAHMAFIRTARDNPDRKFIIKCKPDMEQSWRKGFDLACANAGLSPNGLDNLRITATDDPHELIASAAVVTSLNSTTLLEAGIAGRKVVVPYFKEADDEQMQEYLYFYPGVFEIFDAPRDVAAYEAELVKGLKEQRSITDGELAERIALFERYISPLHGRVTEQFEMLIADEVGRLRTERSSSGGRAESEPTSAEGFSIISS